MIKQMNVQGDPTFEEIRSTLIRISELDGHHIFKLKPEYNTEDRWHEGYIMEVLETEIVFSWAPSPFDESDEAWQKEHRIPIAHIASESLSRNFTGT